MVKSLMVFLRVGGISLYILTNLKPGYDMILPK